MKTRTEYLFIGVSLLLIAAMSLVSYYRSTIYPGLEPQEPVPINGKKYAPGDTLDVFQNIPVFYNGHTGNVLGTSRATNGYVYGLQYQCVEFVKRFYYDFLHHTMPIGSGQAVDFFAVDLADGQMNQARRLRQYQNPSYWKPARYDLLVFRATPDNRYGHVAVITTVWTDSLEIIQQNTGLATRRAIPITFSKNRWEIQDKRVLGWLRKDSLPH
jgi:hypothetical protein